MAMTEKAPRRCVFRPADTGRRGIVLALIITALMIPGSGLAGNQAHAQMMAGESAWDEGHASRARLIAGGSDGASLLAGLEIELAEGYKTYWRHAGDSGLPPAIDWDGSRNVADLVLDFPAPGRFADASGTFFGYEEAVILPLTIMPHDPDEPVFLSVSLSYGVCKDICIPAFADLEMTIPPGLSGRHAPRIARALMQVPQRVVEGERRAGLSFRGFDVAQDGRLKVTVEAPADALLLAEGPDHGWFLDPSAEAVTVAGSDLRAFFVEFVEMPRQMGASAMFRFTLVSGEAGIETGIELDGNIVQRLVRR